MAAREHPGAELEDEVGVLGHRDELAGRHEAPLGVLPAHQRLDRDDLVRAQRHLGLEVQHQLLALGGAAQRVLDLGAPEGAGLHVLVEVVDGGAAALLGHLAGGVGLAQELVGADVARRARWTRRSRR